MVEHVEVTSLSKSSVPEPTLAELRALESKLQKEWLKRVGARPHQSQPLVALGCRGLLSCRRL